MKISKRAPANSSDSILTTAAECLRRANPRAQYELYWTERQGVEIEAKDGKVDALENSNDRALSVRVFENGRTGFAFTTDLGTEAVEGCCTAALEIAALMDPEEDSGLPPLKKGSPKKSSAFAVTPEKKKIEAALKLEVKTRKADRRISGIRSAGVSESRWSKRIVRSDGIVRTDSGGMVAASVTCKASEGDDSQMGGGFRYSKSFQELDLDQVALDAAQRACETLGAKPISTRTCAAILRNDVVSELLGFLSASFSAEEIAKHRSLLLGKQGKKIFSPLLTLTDDALLKGGYATRAMDGEGTPSQKVRLIEKGVFKSVLYDSRYAKKSKTKSTGHAARDFRSVPTIAPTNLILSPGKDSFKALLKKMSNGVIITDLMGVHTANPVTGDFSLGASGMIVERGKIQSSFRGAAVSGKILDILAQVIAVGSDVDTFGSVHTPSLLIEKISVGGTA